MCIRDRFYHAPVRDLLIARHNGLYRVSLVLRLDVYKRQIEGLTEKQVRQKLSNAKIIGTNRFGINSCLYYIFFEDVKGRYLCLFNGEMCIRDRSSRFLPECP